MKKLLEGKVAIVTGAGAEIGIGRAISDLYAEEGANLVLTDIDQTTLDAAVASAKDKGVEAIGVIADSSDPAAPARVFKEAIARFGQVDIMVNNAGVGDMVSIEEASDEHFANVMELNLFGVFRYCREAVQHFMPRNEGVIVNVSSVNGHRPICGAAYVASKAGVHNMTLHIAMRFAGTGIRANTIAPGVTDTEAARAWAAGKQTGGGALLEVAGKYANLTVPSTMPRDQAYAALYLASEMGRAVTGQVIQPCNGAFI